MLLYSNIKSERTQKRYSHWIEITGQIAEDKRALPNSVEKTKDAVELL